MQVKFSQMQNYNYKNILCCNLIYNSLQYNDGLLETVIIKSIYGCYLFLKIHSFFYEAIITVLCIILKSLLVNLRFNHNL